MLNPYHPSPHGDLIKNVTLHSFTTIGSTTPNYRLTLRAKIADALKAANLAEAENVTHLEARLTHPTLDISLSHTEDASVFGWIAKPHKIGVDIECTDRLTTPLIERISTENERLGCPDIRFLWPAKEAAFKALSPMCKVISEIETHSWKKINDSEYMFFTRLTHSDQTIDGTGLVCLIPRHLTSFFVLQH